MQHYYIIFLILAKYTQHDFELQFFQYKQNSMLRKQINYVSLAQGFLISKYVSFWFINIAYSYQQSLCTTWYPIVHILQE